jgi:glycosyltransferase 2 family protein
MNEVPKAKPPWRRIAQWGAGIAFFAGLFALYRFYQSYQAQLHGAATGVSWGEVLLASLVWSSGYVQMIQLWSSSFPWWGSRLVWYKGLRVFFVTNLARYIPGAIWQFAGLATMTKEAGGSAAAASVGVILLQIVTLATGIALTISAAPRLLPWTAGLTSAEQLLIAALLIGLLIVVLPHYLPRIRKVAERVMDRSVPLPQPPRGQFAVYVVRCAGNWLIYGFAFWLFSRALLGPAAPSAWVAISSYVASYIAGLIAVFAPGGIFVREGAIVGLLAPAIGAAPAAILAIASRFWQIAIEVVAAGVMLGLDWIATRIKARRAVSVPGK